MINQILLIYGGAPPDPTLNTWAYKATSTGKRTSAAYATVSDYIYILGWSNESFVTTNTNYRYNTTNNTWSTMSSISTWNYQWARACNCWWNIYIFGTKSTGLWCEKYNVWANTYTILLDIPVTSISNHSVSTNWTDAFLFGWTINWTLSQTTRRYNVSSNTYTTMTNIPIPVQRQAVSNIWTDIYLFGWLTTSSAITKKAYKYDSIGNSYTSLLDVPTNIQWATAQVLYWNIHILGWFDWTNYLQSNLRYNVSANTYTTKASFWVSRLFPASWVSTANKIYVIWWTTIWSVVVNTNEEYS